MRKSYLIAAGLLLALGGAAEAKNPGGLGGGGGQQPLTPPGLSNQTGGHEGFSSQGVPKGWSEPNSASDWKADAASGETKLLPPGFTKPK